MRINLRFKFGNWTSFFMLSHTQTLEGITSKIGEDEHIIMLDLENCTLDMAKATLLTIQKKYWLSHIYILSDIENSYRVICYSIIDFKTLLKIMLDTLYLDYNFFYWTVQRGKATIRISNKLNREPQKIIVVLESYYQPIPKKLEFVIYDTGYDRLGIVLQNTNKKMEE